VIYKGFEIKRAPYRPSQFCAETSAVAIFHDGELQSFVASDEGFAEHVIDVKLKEGAWPKRAKAEPVEPADGKSAAICGDMRQIAAIRRKARQDAAERREARHEREGRGEGEGSGDDAQGWEPAARGQGDHGAVAKRAG